MKNQKLEPIYANLARAFCEKHPQAYKVSRDAVRTMVRNGMECTLEALEKVFRVHHETSYLVTTVEFAKDQKIQRRPALDKLKRMGKEPVCKVAMITSKGHIRMADGYDLRTAEQIKAHNAEIEKHELEKLQKTPAFQAAILIDEYQAQYGITLDINHAQKHVADNASWRELTLPGYGYGLTPNDINAILNKKHGFTVEVATIISNANRLGIQALKVYRHHFKNYLYGLSKRDGFSLSNAELIIQSILENREKRASKISLNAKALNSTNKIDDFDLDAAIKKYGPFGVVGAAMRRHYDAITDAAMARTSR